MDLGSQFSSIAGIGTATGLAVKIIRRAGVNWPLLRKTPVWLIAATVAFGLTLIARYALHSIDGNVADLLGQSVVNAATGSGFYGWLNDPGQSLHDSEETSGDSQPPDVQTDDGSIKLE